MDLLLSENFLKRLERNFRPNLMILLITFPHQSQKCQGAEMLLKQNGDSYLAALGSDDGLRKTGEHHNHSVFNLHFPRDFQFLF